MKKTIGSALAIAIAAGTMSHAAVVSTSGAITQIGAPTDPVGLFPSSNSNMFVFNEVQNLVLSSDLNLGSVSIAAGTRISSHMLFLNRASGKRESKLSGSLAFDGQILGLASTTAGLLATDTLLGAAGMIYNNFTLRGLERKDKVNYSGNSLSARLRAKKVGDWVRIITLAFPPVIITQSEPVAKLEPVSPPAPVPLPASGLLVIGALGALAALRRRASKQA